MSSQNVVRKARLTVFFSVHSALLAGGRRTMFACALIRSAGLSSTVADDLADHKISDVKTGIAEFAVDRTGCDALGTDFGCSVFT